jgi:hypothetical protein
MVKEHQLLSQVFDCHCGPYGIVLNDDAVSCMQESRDSQGNTGMINIHTSTLPESIVATNPQCYSNPDMVCDAINRARKLINREGLHFVEHILLRPHCEEDCDCRLTPCANEFDLCELPYWKDNDEEDPCDKKGGRLF